MPFRFRLSVGLRHDLARRGLDEALDALASGPAHDLVNQISYPGETSYRVSPVTATDRALSKGMDAMVRPLKLG